MKIRLTPLNIASAALLVALIYPLIYNPAPVGKSANTVLLLCLVLLCAVSDILFRGFLRDLKRIWIIEILFIIFAAILLLIIHRF